MRMRIHSRSGYALMTHSYGHIYKTSSYIRDATFRYQLVRFNFPRRHLLLWLDGELLIVN